MNSQASGSQTSAKQMVYQQTTESVEVTVKPVFLEEQSRPLDNHYVWLYQVTIRNNGTETCTLRNRHWKIVDANGKTQEVKGAGVVGEEPILNPGDTFEYSSGTPLNAPSGIMRGTYEMERSSGERFIVEIPAFSLDSPHDRAAFN
ncbi:Co2+/Mg2+ efflux protein ApaG [Kiloniella sp. b19]|uniref:Co2+/Mg2+ efflux protein ApaG n=1 Tax=Kiloniella sp. GXU_MW_B19 TaxID=3141326 RepID=UPI0031D72AAC